MVFRYDIDFVQFQLVLLERDLVFGLKFVWLQAIASRHILKITIDQSFVHDKDTLVFSSFFIQTYFNSS